MSYTSQNLFLGLVAWVLVCSGCTGIIDDGGLAASDAISGDASADADSTTGDATGQDVPGQDVPGQDVPGQDVPGQDVPGQDVPGQDVPGQDMTMMDTPCVPMCSGRMCGADGCGGNCGTCTAPATCNTGSGQCVNMQVCGDGDMDPGELCDGNCPTSCTAPNNCTTSTLMGSAGNCDARCVDAPVSSCTNGDGCCAAGCTINNDDDCSLDCTDLQGWPADWIAAEDDALEQMNIERAAGTDCASGPKSPAMSITMSPQLRIAARCHSVDMHDNNFFSHTGSNGSRFWDRTAAAGYTGTPRFENIAGGNSGGVASVGQWMGSSTGHCDAIMDQGVTEVGIGYHPGQSECWGHCWTAVFGQ